MQLQAYVYFNGTCEEALSFYTKVFGGKVVGLNRYEGTPMMQHVPAGWERKVLHSSFEAPGVEFMASDSARNGSASGGRIALSVSTNNYDEGERAFAMLSDGATVTMPFEKTFWGATFGMLTDRYGIDWMVNSDTPES